MSYKRYDYLFTDLVCIENGHAFTKRVLNESHLHDGSDVPYRTFVPKRELRNVRCPYPGCDSPAKGP
jgi:hypothetical protein